MQVREGRLLDSIAMAENVRGPVICTATENVGRLTRNLQPATCTLSL